MKGIQEEVKLREYNRKLIISHAYYKPHNKGTSDAAQ
jgi:hypothetical protein